jgi:hypothetical protein
MDKNLAHTKWTQMSIMETALTYLCFNCNMISFPFHYDIIHQDEIYCD